MSFKKGGPTELTELVVMANNMLMPVQWLKTSYDVLMPGELHLLSVAFD
jgi:hypothetical protein